MDSNADSLVVNNNVDVYNMEDDLYIYVLPISGGALVCHLALLQELYDARIKSLNGKKMGYFSYAPHISLGSSGGNVSSFIAQASDWTSHGIERNVKYLNSNLFLKKWVPAEYSIIPDIPFILIMGSLYNKGIGAGNLFREIFTSTTIQRSEMWFGTYDIKHKKAQFFCNKSQSDTHVAEPFFNEEQSLYYAMPLKFVDGNLNKLADICIASATIPGVVPSKEIDGLIYADGGVMYPSPLSVLDKEIMRIVTGKERVPISKSYQNEVVTDRNVEIVYDERPIQKEKNLRLFYFFPYQPNGLEFRKASKDIGIRTYLDSILNVSMMQDRNTGIDILNELCPEGLETEEYIKIDSDRLSNIIKELSARKHYIICLFPHRNPSVNIIKLNGDIVRAEMKKVRENYGCQVWYSKSFK